MKAYVLMEVEPMEVEPMKVEEVAEKVRGRGAGGGKCTSVEIVTGPYDLICLCEGPDLKAISACVMKCCAVASVQRDDDLPSGIGTSEEASGSVAAVAGYALGHGAVVGRAVHSLKGSPEPHGQSSSSRDCIPIPLAWAFFQRSYCPLSLLRAS